jgi:hypothetical protein
MSIEPTQADRDAAAAFFPEHLWKQEARDDLAVAFARHRLASTPASGEVVAQWRRIGTAPWWDGLPDHTDGGGPYEERTLYAAPSQPASGEVVAWMYTHSEPGSWPQIFPKSIRDSFGPGWTETPLYKHAAPSHPAADLVEALEYAVNMYGKPGGPWNVPSDPGGWLERARDALAKHGGA